MIPAANDALAEWRDEGRETVRQNSVAFRTMVARARQLADAGQYEAAVIQGCAAAYHAQYRHAGLFTSFELENVLLAVGRAAVRGRSAPAARSPVACPKNVLHVSTKVSGFGGIPGLIRRWIRQDTNRSHSLALTKQAPYDVPSALRDAVWGSQGRIHVLNDARGGLVSRARQLRELAASADVVVLHVWEQDVVPLLAFADKMELPPVIYVNHGDHSFWLGAGVSDVVANLRESGMRLSQERRRIEPQRNMLLPTIMEPVERRVSRAEAKRQLGLSEDSTMLLSIARPPKFETMDGVSFAGAHLPFLTRHERAMLIVVGPGEREDWAAAAQQTQGRIRSLAATTETALFYQAADIYVDSFPFGSNTSLLQAASYGVPVVTRHPYSDACDILGSDMPGLDGNLIRVTNLDEYTAVLSRLAEDQDYRAALGAATRERVAEQHWGPSWQRTLETVYDRAATLPRVNGTSAQADERSLDEPDVYIPRIHGGNFDPDWVVYVHLRAMPLAERWRHWVRLSARWGSRLPISYLLPEWLYCRCWRFGQLLGRARMTRTSAS